MHEICDMEQLDFKILDSNIDKYPRRLTDLLFFLENGLVY